MRRYGLWLAVGLVLLTNVWVLAGVVYNRTGEAEATVVLTERELPKARQSRENTGLFLRLEWSMPGFQKPGRFDPKPGWFNRDKLEALGFRIDLPVLASKAYDYYRHQLPRPAYIVLEMEGDAWEDWKRSALQHLQTLKADLAQATDEKEIKTLERQVDDMKRRLLTQSRLFAVDAGADPEALRVQYPDRNRYIIAQAIVRIQVAYVYRENDRERRERVPVLNGYIQKVSVNTLHLPHLYRDRFLKLTSKARYISFSSPREAMKKIPAPRYAVTLHYGKRYEPWIAELKALK